VGQVGGRRTGCLSFEPKEKRREMLASAVMEHDGKLVIVAHELGYARSHLYRLVYEHHLWPVVNKVRLERIKRERLQRSMNRGLQNG
jgi:hypothetical protein